MQEVRRLRKERGWGQKELAFYAGLAQSVISEVETGKRQPHAGTLEKLAGALKVEVRDLFPKKGQSPLPFEAAGEPAGWIAEIMATPEREFRASVADLPGDELRKLMEPLQEEHRARFAELERVKRSGTRDRGAYHAADRIATLYMIALLQLAATARREADEEMRKVEEMREELEALAS